MEEDREIKAMKLVKEALESLESEERKRVLLWAADKFDLGDKLIQVKSKSSYAGINAQVASGITAQFEDVASLFVAAKPSAGPEKALVVGYWFQIIKDQHDFTGQQINSELKHLGHGLANITSALTELTMRKPQLVIQTQKSGQSRQARKKYKLTLEGIKKVTTLLKKAEDVEE